MPGSNEMLPKFKPGDSIPADWANDLNQQVTALSNIGDDMHVMAVGGMILRRGNKRGGGSPGQIISFEITDILKGFGLGCSAVEAIVTNVSCGGVGVQVGDPVDIWDLDMGCRFALPPNLLIGLKGRAVRMENNFDPYDPALAEGEIRPEGECRWEAITTCCAEEVT